nr:hypothetical protein CFP56_72948 [Quercus suber]
MAAAVVAASEPSGSSTASTPSFCPVVLLDGVANTGSVELGDLQLAAYFAKKKPTGQPFFRNVHRKS